MVSKIGQRKFLLKRGYFESELDKMSPSEAKRIIASIEKIEHPQGQRKVYTEKEINAVKEFVEWLKDQNASYDEKLGLNMLCMDTSQLDDMLEYFIKERENENIKAKSQRFGR